MLPRLAALLLVLLVATTGALAQGAPAGALVDPAFKVPDHAGAVARLLDRYRALAERLVKMDARQQVEGVDKRLAELFLPERPDHFRQRYALELEIFQDPNDLDAWTAIARQYAERGQVDDAAAAAWLVWRRHPAKAGKAAALAMLAEAYLNRGEGRTAVNLYSQSLALEDDGERRWRFDVLKERYELRVADVSLDVERARPAVCVVFNQALARAVRQAPEAYVTLSPAQDVDVRAEERQICFAGLAHGAKLELTVKPGVTGLDGGRLYAEQRRQFTVPDRAQRFSFSRDAYVLPSAADDLLPMTTVNLDKVKLKVYRIDDRNLIAAIHEYLVGQDLYPGAEYNLGETAGAEVWSGEVEVALQRNREVTTLLPVAEMLGPRKPGIYAVVGHLPEETDQTRWQQKATQWLLVSDLGLTTFEGEDGLNVLSRSLGDAGPAAEVELTLIARNNVVLGTATTDAAGHARFPPGLVRGKGGNRAALLVARRSGGDYNFLRLVGSALDLAERGVAGRPVPGPADAFLYPERGVYRPGERVHLSVLLRDERSAALPRLPLTLKVMHPGGVEVFVKTATGDAFGGYGFELPLADTARAGTWTAQVYLDPKGQPVGGVGFLVEDFVPPRIEAKLSTEAKALKVAEKVDFAVQADFYYGAPAADLAVEAVLNLTVDENPFPAHAGFQFGLAQETFRPDRRELAAPATDAAGRSRFQVELNRVPDTTHPLKADLRATVIDVGGRPVGATLSLPVRVRAVEVGIKPRFQGSVGDGDPAAFDIVALDAEGKGVAGRKIAYRFVREHYDYNWYNQGGQWQTRVTVTDEVVEAGELALDGEGRGQAGRPLGWGRYRFEVADAEGASAASRRFHAGWWAASRLPDVPDALELTIAEPDVADGAELKAFVKAPFAGRAAVAVLGERLHRLIEVELPAEGLEIAFPVERDWGPGAYLAVTAFRPVDGQPSLLPTRAMGLGWFSIDRASREVAVEIEAPATALPRRQVTLPVRVASAAGRDLKLTFAAVDEGILSLTRFATPDPRKHYHEQRALGVEVRDLYGYLIPAASGQVGRLRSGGDGGLTLDNVAGPRTRTVESVALYHRDISLDAQGRAQVTLDLPDFNGRLRLMAVAYGAQAVGMGEAALTVRDPLVAEVVLPRFLAPGDRAAATLSLHNLSGKPLGVEVSLKASGALAVEGGQGFRVDLADGERRDTPLLLTGAGVGDGHIELIARAEGQRDVVRDWNIAVRPAWANVTRRQITVLDPAQTLFGAGAETDEFLPGTLSTTLGVAARPDFDAPALLADLRLYPYGCNEQTLSQALPLLYASDLAEAWGAENDDLATHRTVDRAILKLLDRQRADGSLSSWTAFGPDHPWLTAYAFDFLTQARERGFAVPNAAYQQMQVWLENFALNRGNDRLYARAYALYVLARVGAVKASDARYFADNFAARVPTRLGLGHLAATFAVFGEGGRAEALFEQAIAKRRPRGTSIDDYGSDLRDGAAIAALLAKVSDSADRRLALAGELEQEFDRRAWLSTQEQAWLLLATQALTEGDGTLELEVAGAAVGPQTKPYRRRLESDEAAGIQVANLGGQPVRVIVTRRGTPSVPPAAVDNGFALRRSFFTREGGTVDLAAVKRNQQIVVLVEGEARLKVDHEALLVDLLPAGFEIENAALTGAEGEPLFEFLPALTASQFEAARDDRYIAAFEVRGNARGFAFAYLARAVTPGSFVLPGSFVEDMYKPQYHGQLPVGRVTVER